MRRTRLTERNFFSWCSALGAALLYSFVASSLAVADEPRHLGPIELRDQHPLALIHSSPTPTSPLTLEDGTYSTQLSFAWSNTLNRRRGNYLIDAETRVLDLRFRYGVTDRWEVGANLPVVYRGEGVLDPLIDDWHKMFGLPRGKRDKVPDNGFSLAGENEDGTEFDLHGDGTRFGTAELTSKVRLPDELPGTWASVFALGLPTGRNSYGHDGVDIGVGLVGTGRAGDLRGYWGASYFYYSDPHTDDLTFERHHGAAFLHGEYPVTANISLLVGTLLTTGLLEDVKRFPDYAIYLDTGFRWNLAAAYSLEFLLRENPAPRDGTVDVTGLLAFTFRAD